MKKLFSNLSKIILLLIVFFIVYYLQLGGNLKKHVIDNWSYYKCQPYIIPFAGFFRGNQETLSFWEFTVKNFQKCQWSKIKSFFSYFIQPLQYILKIITKIIKDFRNTINIFRVEAKQIRGMFKTIVEKIAEKLTNSYSAINYYQAKMQNIIKQQLAILQIMMYFAEAMKLTMVSLVNGPVIEMVKFLPAFGIALLALIAICLACMFGGPFTKMVACPICLVCFNGNSKCVLQDDSLKSIKDISIGEKLAIGGYVKSRFVFDLKSRKCDMYQYRGIEVSGSHIVFDQDQVFRIARHRDAKPINYQHRYIYCLNTEKHYIHMKNSNNQSIVFSDFYESSCNANNYKTQRLIENRLNGGYLYDFRPNKDTCFHDYEWGLGYNTQIRMRDSSYKSINEISMGDQLYGGGKVYGLVKHCAKSSLIYKYKNTELSGSQLVLVDDVWKRTWMVSQSRLANNYSHRYLYHLVCDKHKFQILGKIWVRDYLELREDDSVFDILLDMNIRVVKKHIQPLVDCK